MGVTTKQIAEMAGVHRSTVDKVLHNRPGVSDEVRQKIKALLEEYHYEANPIGKALQMQDKKLHVAALLLRVDALPYIQRGIEKKLKEYRAFQLQIDFHVGHYSDIAEQIRRLQKCREEKVAGIIISPINHPDIVEEINLCQQSGICVVTVNIDSEQSRRICFVGQNGYKAGQVAARFMGEFLVGQGKVAVITSSSGKYQSFPFGTREDGFRASLRECFPQICVLPSVFCDEDAAVMRRETRRLLRENPNLSGILVTCGCVSAACEVLQEFDRSDIRLICFECYPEILQFLQQGVVTLALNSGLEQQGQDGTEILLDKLIYGREPAEKQKYSPVVAVVKESL